MSTLNPSLVDVILPESGYPQDKAAGDTRDVLWDVCGAASRKFSEKYWIDPKDWREAAEERKRTKTWGMNFLDRYTNQNPTHECTCHSLRANFESCWNRHRGIIFPEGPKKGFRYEQSKLGSVWVSPLSVYAEANPGQWGGAGVRQVLEIAVRRGMLPELVQPTNYNFKHRLQGTTGNGNSNQERGSWVRLSQFPEGWQETAKFLMPDEIIFPESFEEAVCLLLAGLMVSVGRNGHAVPWGELIFDGDDLEAAAYADSYDITRYDSVRTMKYAWQGSFAIASVTTPDDWMNPAPVNQASAL